MEQPAFMHRCLELASLGRGRVGNGALVGAVLVRDGAIIAEGFHAGYGEAHAERMLLENFEGEILPDDILYVNLEPCCHQGKTPPCTNLLIEKGIKNVVYGMLDPDARVTGKGIDHLRSNGVHCISSSERALCEKLNTGFIQVRTHHRPFITIKKAITAQGKVACDDGKQLKITSPEQDQWSHRFLRARHDAILVGIGTILSDNPQLNIRVDQSSKFSLQIGLNEKKSFTNNFINPYKIILDPELKMYTTAKVISNTEPHRTIICIDAAGDHDPQKMQMLRERGVQIFTIEREGDRFAWDALWDVLITPRGDYHGITSILAEGGPKTWQAFQSARCVDQEITLIGK